MPEHSVDPIENPEYIFQPAMRRTVIHPQNSGVVVGNHKMA
jgi:hypothetical protein